MTYQEAKEKYRQLDQERAELWFSIKDQFGGKIANVPASHKYWSLVDECGKAKRLMKAAEVAYNN
jgi:hypothetical protein